MIVKICGLRTVEAVEAAAEAGARCAGFVFFPKSPRHITIAEARRLTLSAPLGLMKIALAVNPDDELLDEISTLPIDMIQLHGRESPERVREVRARSGLPVMKAVGVASAADLPAIDAYASVADQLLIDAKPPEGGPLPGGNGLAFDWRLIAGREWPKPWMLAGGLHAGNVAEAVHLTGARQIDVSSGVESSPGVKDSAKIRAFVSAALAA